MPTSSPSAASLFQALGTQLLTDTEGNAKDLLNAFFNNVKATPTPQNVIAQGAILAASAPLQLPNLEAEAIGQIATVGQQLLALLPTPTAPTA